MYILQWRYNGCDGVLNQQPCDCLLNCLFRRRSKKTSKLRVTGLCNWQPVNSPLKEPVKRKMFPFDDVIVIPKYERMISINRMRYSVRCHYNVVPYNITWHNIPYSTDWYRTKHSDENYSRHPITIPLRWAMGCILWRFWIILTTSLGTMFQIFTGIFASLLPNCRAEQQPITQF